MSDPLEPGLLRQLADLIEKRGRMAAFQERESIEIDLHFTYGRSLGGYDELRQAIGAVAGERFGDLQREAMRRIDDEISALRVKTGALMQ